MKRILIIAAALLTLCFAQDLFRAKQLMQATGIGAPGAKTRKMQRLLKVCMPETNEFCTADGGLEGILDCLDAHIDDLSERCYQEYRKVR